MAWIPLPPQIKIFQRMKLTIQYSMRVLKKSMPNSQVSWIWIMAHCPQTNLSILEAITSSTTAFIVSWGTITSAGYNDHCEGGAHVSRDQTISIVFRPLSPSTWIISPLIPKELVMKSTASTDWCRYNGSNNSIFTVCTQLF